MEHINPAFSVIREITQEDFIIHYYHCNRNTDSAFNLHFEKPTLCICLSNGIYIQTNGHQAICLNSEQHLMIYSPEPTIAVPVNHKEECRFITISITTDFLRRLDRNKWLIDFRNKIDNGIFCLFPNTPQNLTLPALAIVEQLLNTPQGGEQSRRVLFSVMQLLKLTIRNLHVGSDKMKELLPNYQGLMNAKSYLETNLSLPLTANDLARQAGITEWKLSEQFKQMTGYTVTQFIVGRRIEKAKTLLLQNDLAIIKIHAMVGYKTHTDLNHQFKKHTGFSLKQYKQQCLGH